MTEKKPNFIRVAGDVTRGVNGIGLVVSIDEDVEASKCGYVYGSLLSVVDIGEYDVGDRVVVEFDASLPTWRHQDAWIVGDAEAT